MALTKVNRGGLNTGVSDSSNATFLTVDSSEQAVIKSEGGAATTSVQQGLAKMWCTHSQAGSYTLDDSFNVGSIADNGAGETTINFTNAPSNANYAVNITSGSNSNRRTIFNANNTTRVKCETYEIDSYNNAIDSADVCTTVHGDLA